MATAEELVVAIKSEGVSETQSDLEGVERKMDETASNAGDAASDLEGFSQKFKGAMSAAVAALSIGAAGLLSNVPVVGEAFAGLGAIVDALTLKIDDDLRPTLGGFRDDLFAVAEDVYNAENSLDAFMTGIDGLNTAIDSVTVSTIQSEIESLSGVRLPANWIDFGWDLITLDARQTMDNVGTIIDEFPQDLGTMLNSTAPVAKQGLDMITAQFNSFVDDITSRVRGGVSDVREFFMGLGSDLAEWGNGVATDAKKWGTNLIQKFIDGIQSKLNTLRNWLSELRNVGAEVGIDVPTLGGGGGGGSSGGGSSRQPFAGGFFSGGGATLDGRQITESTGRYRGDPNRRRGL